MRRPKRREHWGLDLFACLLIPAYTLLFAGSVEWFSTNFNVEENTRLMSEGYLDNGFNVLDEIDLVNNRTNQMNVRTKVGMDFNILEGLKLSADYQYERTHGETKEILSEDSYEIRTSIINQFIITLKDTSILSVIGFPELVNTAKNVVGITMSAFQVWSIVAIMYLVVITLLSRLAKRVERRLNRGRQ